MKNFLIFSWSFRVFRKKNEKLRNEVKSAYHPPIESGAFFSFFRFWRMCMLEAEGRSKGKRAIIYVMPVVF